MCMHAHAYHRMILTFSESKIHSIISLWRVGALGGVGVSISNDSVIGYNTVL